jgi:hypothetical protein
MVISSVKNKKPGSVSGGQKSGIKTGQHKAKSFNAQKAQQTGKITPRAEDRGVHKPETIGQEKITQARPGKDPLKSQALVGSQSKASKKITGKKASSKKGKARATSHSSSAGNKTKEIRKPMAQEKLLKPDQ